MKYDISKPILDYEGNPVTVQKRDANNQPILDRRGKPEMEDVSWQRVIFVALNADPRTDQMTAEKKEMAYRITQRAYKGKMLSLSIEELSFLLERIGESQSTLVFGRAKQLFEGLEDESSADAEDEDKSESKKK